MPVVVYGLIPAGGFYFILFLKILICRCLSWTSDIFPNINKLVSVLILPPVKQRYSTRSAYLTGFPDLLFKWSYNILQIGTCTNMRLYTTHFLPVLGPRAGCNMEKSKVCWYACLCAQTSAMWKHLRNSHAVSCQDLVILVWQGPSMGTREKHKKCLKR